MRGVPETSPLLRGSTVSGLLTSDGISDAEPNGGDEWRDVGKGEDAKDGDREEGAGRAENPAEPDVIDHPTQKRRQHHGNVVYRPGVVGRYFLIDAGKMLGECLIYRNL